MNRSTNYLPLATWEVSTELQSKARQELNEDLETRSECIEKLKELLKDEHELHFQSDDDFLLRFLRTKKFNLSRTSALIKNYYKTQKTMDWSSIHFKDCIQVLEHNIVGVLPYRDAEGNVLAYYMAGSWNRANVPENEMIKTVVVLLNCILRYPPTQIAGLKVILDCSQYSYRHLNISIAVKLVKCLLNSFPGRYKGVHVLHQGRLITYVFEIVKLLMSKKLTERIHFHGSDMKSLYEFISPEILPEECGGQLGPIDYAVAVQEMWKYENVFEETKHYGYADERRHSQSTN